MVKWFNPSHNKYYLSYWKRYAKYFLIYNIAWLRYIALYIFQEFWISLSSKLGNGELLLSVQYGKVSCYLRGR